MLFEGNMIICFFLSEIGIAGCWVGWLYHLTVVLLTGNRNGNHPEFAYDMFTVTVTEKDASHCADFDKCFWHVVKYFHFGRSTVAWASWPFWIDFTTLTLIHSAGGCANDNFPLAVLMVMQLCMILLFGVQALLLVLTMLQWNLACSILISLATDHYHNRFTALFSGPSTRAGARSELLDFMVEGKINGGRHTDHPAGRHFIRTNQCPPPPWCEKASYNHMLNLISHIVVPLMFLLCLRIDWHLQNYSVSCHERVCC